MTTKEKELSNPAYLIEVSQALRHIIMNRRYFLRSTRARTMFCREQIAGKSWLEVTLVEKAKADVLPWDMAHSLADKIRAELKADVFVEPAHEVGRHHQLTGLKNAASPFADSEHGDNRGSSPLDFDPVSAMGAGSGMEMFGGAVRRGGPVGGQFGISGMGMGLSGMPNIPGMPNIGGSNSPFNISGTQNYDPADFLPANVREALAFGDGKKNGEVVLPALREIAEFQQLPEAIRNMFEVEAVQVLQGMMAQIGPSEHSGQSLVALTKLDNVSKRLKRFLSEALLLEAA